MVELNEDRTVDLLNAIQALVRSVSMGAGDRPAMAAPPLSLPDGLLNYKRRIARRGAGQGRVRIMAIERR